MENEDIKDFLMDTADELTSYEDKSKNAPEKGEGLDEDELLGKVNAYKAMMNTHDYDVLQTQRMNANYAYNHDDAELFAPSSMSNVVDNYMTPAVDTLGAYLTKIFCADKEVVTFTPSNDELIDLSKQAMGMLNHTVFKANNGYDIMSTAFKDAAINHNAILKLSWHSDIVEYEEDYEDITEEELTAIITDKEAQGYECEVVKEETITVTEIDELTGFEVSGSTMSVTIKCMIEFGKPMIENVPPEEFNINAGATSIHDNHLTRYVEHVKLVTMETISEMFPDVDVEELPSLSSYEYDSTYEKQARHNFDDTYDQTDDFSDDTRWVELTECWIKADFNNDGREEWRHMFLTSNDVLQNDEWFGPLPFYSFTYFPVPHKFYGQGVWTRIEKYQRGISGLLRSESDMRFLQNTFQIIADPNMFDDRDLQSGKPGIIRARKTFDPSKIMAMPKPSGAPNTLQLMEYYRTKIAASIGIDPINGQISSDIEKSGNDSVKTSMVMDNASTKVEGYAREFAENCLRPLLWDAFNMLIDHADSYYVRMLAETISPGVPFEPERMEAIQKTDLTAKVGLGHMSGQQKIAAIGVLLQLQKELANDPVSPLVTPPQAKLKLAYEMARGWGFENPAELFGTEEQIAQTTQEFKAQQQQAQQAQQAQMQGQAAAAQAQQQSVQGQLAIKQQEAQAKASVMANESTAKIAKLRAEADKLELENDRLALLPLPGEVNESVNH